MIHQLLTTPAARLADDPAFLRMYADVLRQPADDAPRFRLAAWLRCEGHPFGAWLRSQLAGRGPHAVPPASDAEPTGVPPIDFPPLPPELTATTRFQWSRVAGLIGHVRCTEETLLLHAAAIFTSYPIVCVSLANRKSWGTRDAEGEPTHAIWNGDKPDTEYGPFPPLDIRVAGRLTGFSRRRTGSRRGIMRWEYPSLSAADAAVSRACVAFGRDLVGLPRLPESKEVGSLQTY